MKLTVKMLLAVWAACLMGILGATAAAQTPGAAKPASQPYLWQNVTIVAGGFVPGIVFSPKQKGLIYARTDIGGVYRWSASQKQWIPLTDWADRDNANLMGGESVAPDPVDPKRVYVAGGMYSGSSVVAILSSTDQGKTFKRNDVPFRMGGNEDGRSVGERLAVDPHKNSILYFGSRNDGLWKSSDYAATWSKIDSFPVTGRTNGVGIAFVVFDKNQGASGQATPVIYVGVAAAPTALYRSVDAGATWQAVSGQPTDLEAHHGVLDKDGTLYLTYGNTAGPNGMSDGAVWKYDTSNQAWTDITPIKPNTGNEKGFGYAGLALDAQHPGTVMVTTMDRWNPGDDIFRTTDGGKTWKGLAAQSVRDASLSPYLKWGGDTIRFGWWIGTIAIDPFDSGHVLYGTGATIWSTHDATAADSGKPTHWTVGAAGLEETAVIDLISPPSGPHLISGLGDIGGFAHDDLTVSPRTGMWTNPTMSNTDSLDFAESNPALVVRVGRGQPGKSGAYSIDGGTTWTPFPSEPVGRGSGSVAISADDSILVWTPNRGMTSYSRDRGTTWMPSAGAPSGLRIISDRVNSSKFYGFDSRVGAVYVSTNDGASFAICAQNLPTGNAKLRALPGTEGDLWLTVGSAAYHSTDSGKSFTKLDTVQEVYSLGFGKAPPGRTYPALYMAGKVSDVTGIFRSDDSGATWVRINDDQHQYGWASPVIGDPRIYGRVYIGTNGRGVLYADPVSGKG